MSNYNYITPGGMQELRRKQIALQIERPKVLEQVQTAREMGDLSENAEYHAAKERQRNIDRELANISNRISALKIVDPKEIPKDSIRFGARVKLQLVSISPSKNEKQLQKNKVETYDLVGVDEVWDTDNNILRVSIASPIGEAMLGKKIDEEFEFNAPNGNTYNYKVLKIS